MKAFVLIETNPNTNDVAGKIMHAIALSVHKRLGAFAEEMCKDVCARYLEVDGDIEDPMIRSNAHDSAVTTVAIAMLSQALIILRNKKVGMPAPLAIMLREWPELVAEIRKTKEPRRARRR